jgi:hypothetical protein
LVGAGEEAADSDGVEASLLAEAVARDGDDDEEGSEAAAAVLAFGSATELEAAPVLVVAVGRSVVELEEAMIKFKTESSTTP